MPQLYLVLLRPTYKGRHRCHGLRSSPRLMAQSSRAMRSVHESLLSKEEDGFCGRSLWGMCMYAVRASISTYMGASINRGHQNKPKYMIVLIIGTTKFGAPNFRKQPYDGPMVLIYYSYPNYTITSTANMPQNNVSFISRRSLLAPELNLC